VVVLGRLYGYVLGKICCVHVSCCVIVLGSTVSVRPGLRC